jgi:SAM-dependent methyltransferase
MKLKSKLVENRLARSAYYSFHSLEAFFLFDLVGFIKNVKWFLSDYIEFKKQLSENSSRANIDFLYPQLRDKTKSTPIDPIYFYQDAWAARKIFNLKPIHHYDVGSAAKTIGIISQFVPTTMIDIRPLELNMENLYFKKGSILNLPLESNSINSISSLCVIEHIGLGRYGDPIDVFGSEKAIKELIRVTAPQGLMLISVPVSSADKIFFNAHRVFNRDYILNIFSNCELIEERYILGHQFLEKFSSTNEFQIGLFMFKKL